MGATVILLPIASYSQGRINHKIPLSLGPSRYSQGVPTGVTIK